jgi:hypothetical protein
VVSTAALPGRLVVTERTGLVRLVDETTGVIGATPYLDMTAVVNSAGGEQGLLGIAFAPDFLSSRHLYLTFTDASGALILRRVTVSNASAASAGSPVAEDLLAVPHPGASNHNGGSLAFDSAGRLLLGTGDGGGAGDPGDNARNTSILLGKVLRLDVSRACAPLAYCIPASNPFAASGGRPEIWLWGLRNPWRTTLDPVTGLFYVADVGQNRWEELDVVPETSPGADLQWSCREGLEQFNAARCGSTATQISPVTVMCHGSVAGCAPADTGASVTGGQVYRGGRLASSLTGAYVFGDFVSANIWAWAGGSRSVITTLPQVTSFGTDTRGELVATTLSGSLSRLELAGAAPPPALPAPAPATGGQATTAPPAASDAATVPSAATAPPASPITSSPIAAPARVLPARVASLRLQQTHASGALASWSRPAGAAVVRFQFRVQRGTSRYGPWRDTTATRVIIKGLHQGRTYRVQVRALADDGPGPAATVRVTAR